MATYYSSEAINELDAALHKSSSGNVLQFPRDLQESNHWICLRAVERVFGKTDDYATKDDKFRIFLPLPANLGTQYAQDYTAEGIGVAGMAGAATGEAAFNAVASDDPVKSISSLVSNIASGISKEGAVDFAQYYGVGALEEAGGAIGAAIGGAAGGIAGLAGQQYIKGAFAGAGVARNPYMAVLYNNPQFREFLFSWKLVARSYQESVDLYGIVQNLKYYAAPGINARNKHFFNYPEQWDIDFSEQDNTFNIGPSILKNISVNYHAEGQPLYFRRDESIESGPLAGGKESFPVSIQLDLSFQEVFIITKDDIVLNAR